jgi:hypothetical protein
MAAYVTAQSPNNSYTMIPMKSTPGIKFDFAMAMGVRYGDEARKIVLDKLIETETDKVRAIIASYNIPLLPISKDAVSDDD